MSHSAENDADCACGRGPGHIRIKAAGCNPDTRRHARGCAAAVAPSARCTCPIPPGQVPCVCGEQMTEPYPNDTGEHSTTECPIPPGTPSIHICPECGEPVTRESGEPYWVEPETKQRHHDPCPIPPGQQPTP